MINLLPDNLKEQMRYARSNRILLHWCVATTSIIFGIIILVVFGNYYISTNKKALRNTITLTNQRIAREKLPEAQKEYESLAGGVQTVVQIMAKQLLFSQLIPILGNTLPEGAVLTSLTLTPDDIALDLQVAAKDSQTAAQTQINFASDGNKLFQKADIISLTCSSTSDPDAVVVTETQYPCALNLRVLYKQDASFLFLNSLEAKAP